MQIIKQLESKVVQIFGDDKTGHNMTHLWRTLNFALKIWEHEGGDKLVIATSSFLHDLHRIMQTKEKRFVPPVESIPLVRELISDLPLTEQQKQHVCYAIEHHEEYAFSEQGVTVKDIESKILQDADNLDMLGAMGLYRQLEYGHAHGHPIFVPDIPLTQGDFTEGDKNVSTVHSIVRKTLRLAEAMNTPTARKMAGELNQFQVEFVKRIQEEYITPSFESVFGIKETEIE
ncbi:MAG: HD domain-containing protein [Firmicutes bacterium]|nr:HD domain-containing protein [Bacillota bacterium]